MGDAAGKNDGVAVSLEHDGQKADGLGDLVRLRLKDQICVPVTVLDALFNDPAVARAEKGKETALAADFFIISALVYSPE